MCSCVFVTLCCISVSMISCVYASVWPCAGVFLSLCVVYQCLWIRVSVLLCGHMQLCLCHSVLCVRVYDFVCQCFCVSSCVFMTCVVYHPVCLWYTLYQCLWFCHCNTLQHTSMVYCISVSMISCLSMCKWENVPADLPLTLKGLSGRNRPHYQNETYCVYRFHWNFTPLKSESNRSQKLKFLGTNSNQTKISIWILYHKIPKKSESQSLDREDFGDVAFAVETVTESGNVYGCILMCARASNIFWRVIVILCQWAHDSWWQQDFFCQVELNASMRTFLSFQVENSEFAKETWQKATMAQVEESRL